MRWVLPFLFLFSGVALAQPAMPVCPVDAVGCDAQDADWLWRDQLFDTIDFDSGWVPAGSPLQLRLTFHLAGATEIGMGGTPTTSWPTALELQVPGRPGTGTFTIDYGMEIRAYFRFDVDVAGIRYTFEDEIDIPFIPMDLRFYDELMFDPFLLPDADPVMVSDRTERFSLVELDLAGFVGIPGVGGGLRLDTEGELRATYRSTAIVVADAMPILEELGTTIVGPDRDGGEPGFGAAKDILIHPEGVLNYEGALIFFPTVFLDVLGTGFDIPLAEIPIDIVELMNDVVFDDVLVHVPLPDIDVDDPELDFGEVFVGETATLLLRVGNEGEAELGVDMGPVGDFSVADPRLDLPPMSFRSVEVSFTPTSAGPAREVMWLESNDPDEPMILVRLIGQGVSMSVPDAGVMMDDAGFDAGMPDGGLPTGGGGCGCRTTSGTDASSFILALLVFGMRRRR